MDVDGSEVGSLAFRGRFVCMGIGFSFLLRFGIAGGRNGIGGGATWGGSTSSLDRSFNARFDFYSIELDLLLLLDDKRESSRAFFFLFFARMQNNVYQNCPQFSFSSLLGIFILENLSSVSSDLRINNICNKEKKKMRR